MKKQPTHTKCYTKKNQLKLSRTHLRILLFIVKVVSIVARVEYLCTSTQSKKK